MRLERIAFRKVEVWLVGLLLVLATIGGITFGAIIYDTTKGKARFGSLGETAVLVAKAPWTVEEVLHEAERMQSKPPRRFEGTGGWQIEADSYPDYMPGFILISRHDGDKRRHVLELYDLTDLSVAHRWWPDADELHSDVRRDWIWMDYTAWRRSAWRAIHPLLLENGDLIVKDQYAPLFRVSACGERVWKKDDIYYHHSTEPDGEGGFWITTDPAQSDIPGVTKWFVEDRITRMTPDGEVLFEKSIVKAYYENGLFHRIFGAGFHFNSPLHVNDAQPVLEDGPYWKKGDVFVSIRRYSTILLYRPSTDKIVWLKEGPWLDQHDVDIIDDHTIAIFNNNIVNTGKGRRVRDVSEVMFYDFETDTVTSPYRAEMEKYAVRTETEGLFDFLPTGHMMLEEENSGRLLLFAPDRSLVASFINNNSEETGFRMGWSRYIPEELGQRALAAIKTQDCQSEF